MMRFYVVYPLKFFYAPRFTAAVTIQNHFQTKVTKYRTNLQSLVLLKQNPVEKMKKMWVKLKQKLRRHSLKCKQNSVKTR